VHRERNKLPRRRARIVRPRSLQVALKEKLERQREANKRAKANKLAHSESPPELPKGETVYVFVRATYRLRVNDVPPPLPQRLLANPPFY
jgi:hypothetical protein